MKVKELPVRECAGHVILHSHAGPDGKRAVGKGKRLEPEDLERLQGAGAETLWVGELEPDDVPEDEAVSALGALLAGPGLLPTTARGGRVDLIPQHRGLFRVDVERLLDVNRIPGVGVATVRRGTPLEEGKRAVTVKVIPYALGRERIETVRTICSEGALFSVKPYVVRSAVLVTVGPEGTHEEVGRAFRASLDHRLGALGVSLAQGPRAGERVEEIQGALAEARSDGPGMIVIAGHTSIVDGDDQVPRALRAVGADIVQHGLPTEPGSLLLLGYWGETPVVAAASCARSLRPNGIDLILPRLAAGERLEASDLAALGHGGLLG